MTSLLILAALALLAGRHLTIWVAWWPVASVPALGLALAVIPVAAVGMGALVALRLAGLRLAPVWRAA